jgi:diguanylate cyclase (GGDEF)-like protein
MQPNHRLRAVIAIQQEVVAAGLDPDAVAQLVAERAHSLVGAAGAVVELVEDHVLIYRGVAGDARPHRGQRLALDGSLSGRAVLERRTLATADAVADTRVDRETAARLGIAAMACVPLVHADRCFGVLKTYTGRPIAFGDADVELLELLSGVIAAQLSHALDYAQAWRDGRQDAVTGLLNRRAYDETLARETARAGRHARELALCLFDLDDFKAVNDAGGHLAGDEVLRRFAAVLLGVRGEDFAFRVGGDEFALVLPETGRGGADTVTQRLLEASEIPASVGTATYPEATEPQELHAVADADLYGAKRRRN